MKVTPAFQEKEMSSHLDQFQKCWLCVWLSSSVFAWNLHVWDVVICFDCRKPQPKNATSCTTPLIFWPWTNLRCHCLTKAKKWWYKNSPLFVLLHIHGGHPSLSFMQMYSISRRFSWDFPGASENVHTIQVFNLKTLSRALNVPSSSSSDSIPRDWHGKPSTQLDLLFMSHPPNSISAPENMQIAPKP